MSLIEVRREFWDLKTRSGTREGGGSLSPCFPGGGNEAVNLPGRNVKDAGGWVWTLDQVVRRKISRTKSFTEDVNIPDTEVQRENQRFQFRPFSTKS